jgi:branched-chain amino acid transport system ATP-binding protein
LYSAVLVTTEAGTATASFALANHSYSLADSAPPAAGRSLSGGEQQMLAIGRALVTRPCSLVLDEPCLGLAPPVARQIMQIVSWPREQGMSILLVEQNARTALWVADRGYVMGTDKIVLQ